MSSRPLSLALALSVSWGLLVDCASAKGEPAPPTLRVLFVGNSYIYSNELPDIVAAVAASRGVELQAGMLALPNFAIEDHLRSGDYQQFITQGWDWVILQQGPSSLPENAEHLRLWAGRAARQAQALGVKVALMSAWPALANAHTWLAAEQSYRDAAIAADACVFPVATAWRHGRNEFAAIELYAPDQLHPSRAGSLLAALVIARGILPGPFLPQPPRLQGLLGSEWTNTITVTATLDGVANLADQGEFARCRLDK